ncbi:MAG TPA: hypothetical protein VFK89_09850 [Actinomycetota bacterium]|nr:hypothetical protein [Actinomycetota bacterium]
MDDWSDEDAARLLGWVRILTGLVLFFMPRVATRMWTGESTADRTTDLGLKGMGARDVALGVGLVTALEKGAPVRGWLEGGVLADAGDALGTLVSWRDLPRGRGLLWFAAEAGAAVLGFRLAERLD